MKTFKNILVGLDTSKESTNVLQRAFLLSDKNSVVTIIHAIDNNWIDELFTSYEELKKHAFETIKNQISKVDTKDIEYSIKIDKKSPVKMMMEIIKEKDVDLIIIGANEDKNDQTAIVTSTASKIAQESKLPMLIVKNKCLTNSQYSNIVFFSDLSNNSLDSLNYAKKSFNLNNIKTVYAYKQMGEIALTYYNENKNKDKIQLGIKEKENKKFKDFIQKNNLLDADIIESYSSTNNAIIEYVNSNNNDLAILSSKGLNNLNTIVFGSTTLFLIENLKTDLLIYIK